MGAVPKSAFHGKDERKQLESIEKLCEFKAGTRRIMGPQ